MVSRVLRFCEIYDVSQALRNPREWNKIQRKFIPLVQVLWSRTIDVAKTKCASFQNENYGFASPHDLKKFVKYFFQPYFKPEIGLKEDLLFPPEFGGWFHRLKTNALNPLLREIEEFPEVLNFAGKVTTLLCGLDKQSKILYPRIIKESKVFKPSIDPKSPYTNDNIRNILWMNIGPGILEKMFFDALNVRGLRGAKPRMKLAYVLRRQAYRIKILRTIHHSHLTRYILEDILANVWNTFMSLEPRILTRFCYPSCCFEKQWVGYPDMREANYTTFVEQVLVDLRKEKSILLSSSLKEVERYLREVDFNEDNQRNILIDIFDYFGRLHSVYLLKEPSVDIPNDCPLRWLNANALLGMAELETFLLKKGWEITPSREKLYSLKLNKFSFVVEFPSRWDHKYVIRLQDNEYVTATHEEWEALENLPREAQVSRLKPSLGTPEGVDQYALDDSSESSAHLGELEDSPGEPSVHSTSRFSESCSDDQDVN